MLLPALLLLPGLLGAAPAGPVPGSPECTGGSAAWCRDLQAAAGCGALGHCRSAVWSQPSARTLPCDVCLDVVAAAGNGANPNTTDADVLALVTQTCEWLPGRDSPARCKEMVGAHSPALLSMLGGPPGSAPPQVCTALTLCRPLQSRPTAAAAPGPLSEEDTSELMAPFLANGGGPLSFHLPPVPEDPVCGDCVRLVSRLQQAVGSNVSALADLVTQEQCRSVGPGLAQVCREYIERFLGPGEHMLRLVLPEETCERGGFCEEEALAPSPPEPLAGARRPQVPVRAGLSCEVCLQVVQELDQWLDNNSTEALISQALERVCSVMPTSIVRQCITMVDTYSPSLVEFVTRVPPERVCKAIRLCDGDGSNRLLPLRRRLRRRAPALLGPRATLLPPLLDRDDQGSFCHGCKRLLGVSARNLERKSTKRGILQAFKGGCRILPLPYMVQCNRFVDEYEPVLFATLSEVMDPAALCARVGACHPPRAPLLGSDQCVLGPGFWCASAEAAQMCDALEHCRRFVWRMAPFDTGEPECPPRLPASP